MTEPTKKEISEVARAMGHKGGTTTKARYGHEHFVEIGKKGGARRADLTQKGKLFEAQLAEKRQ